jgi:signal transduction histidine kinase/CheY-like chemotaxis protein
VLPGDSSFHDFQVDEDFAGVGRRDLVLSGCRLDGLNLILLAIEDVTERSRSENALRHAQEHLRQAQKMEAIGRLAGGVAHDFNNMLTAILGYASLILQSSTDQLAIGATREIQSAGERAAALTAQLLAFSRRQALQPQVLDLNGILADLDRMLRHLLGDQLRVTISAATGLWPVKADPGEIGRAIINLCLNARDAMPGGGTLTIRTANVMPDEGAERNLAGGRYVELAVADTGIGMDSAVKDHIFEPFFTTKEFGKGTGLGLASVLGIVEQSGGAIRCDSEVGQGTTFRIFLPAMAEGLETIEPARTILALAPKGSSEVILLVEDEDMVRTLARTILVTSGYVVLEAHDGGEALAMSESHEGVIDLLLSDVMMPVLGGRELAERTAIGRPGMKVLFMSGHTPDAILREGIGKGIAFLPKPFRPADLVYKVREVLDSPARSQAQSGG